MCGGGGGGGGGGVCVRWVGDKDRLYVMKLFLYMKRFSHQRGSNLGPLNQQASA